MIFGTLSWYGEPVEFLDRCVRSLAGVVAHLLALDGRWQHFGDDLPARSPENEWETIREAAQAIGLPCTIVGPNTDAQTGEPVPWKSQVEKRAKMCDIAVALGAEWVFVIDGDEYVSRLMPGLRDALDVTDRDVALVEMIRPPLPGGQSYAGKIRRFYSCAQGLTIDKAHNGYRTCELKPRWLHGDSAYARLEKPADLSDYLTLTHVHAGRPADREEARRAYRSARRRLLFEEWMRPKVAA